MAVRVYTYEKCDTCRKAVRWLAERGVAFEVVPIRECPPAPGEIRAMMAHVGDLRRLFNTSGRDYKDQGLKDRMPAMSQDEAIALLAANGNLVKRPFILTAAGGAVGFKADEWERLV